MRRAAAGDAVMDQLQIESTRQANPVDIVEQVALGNDWEFERAGDDEISIAVTGQWAEYAVSFSWMEDLEALHLACAFDLKVPDARVQEALALLSLVNEQLLIGHFDLWAREGVIMFRQSLLLNGGAEPNGSQLECLLASAVDAAERYYPAFQYAIWSGHSAREALEAAMFETQGNA
jgi:hypothetical protein